MNSRETASFERREKQTEKAPDIAVGGLCFIGSKKLTRLAFDFVLGELNGLIFFCGFIELRLQSLDAFYAEDGEAAVLECFRKPEEDYP